MVVHFYFPLFGFLILISEYNSNVCERERKHTQTCDSQVTKHRTPSFSTRYLIVMDDPLGKRLVQHLLVPLLKALRFRDFLIRGVAMEDVVVSFAWGTGPDVSCHIPA